MRITAVRTTPLFLPYRQPYHWAYGVVDGAEPVLVEVETDAGITGTARALAPPTRQRWRQRSTAPVRG